MKNFINQNEKTIDEITKLSDFKHLVDETVKSKVTYYNWLKQNVPAWTIGDFQMSQEYSLKYIWECMMLDTEPNTSVVYFIRNKYNGFLKIGKTNNLERRFNEIKRGFTFLGLDTQELVLEAISFCPYEIDFSEVELYYHNLFKDKRRIGEWFDISSEDLINNLHIDFVTNGVMVIVEDTNDFSCKNKFNLAESNVEDLKKQVEKECLSKILKDIYNNYSFIDAFNFTDNNYFDSKNLYEYLISAKETINLDKKIKHNVEKILDFVNFNASNKQNENK